MFQFEQSFKFHISINNEEFETFDDLEKNVEKDVEQINLEELNKDGKKITTRVIIEGKQRY